jgi:Fe2+ transport system protein B
MNTKNIALVGNPNCGKTSLFNTLTGTRQKVANYAGVTVERKEGFLNYLLAIPFEYWICLGLIV